jgi:catechol 2,3-dioxygenase-like lactoylglutathione lyase family enzyme
MKTLTYGLTHLALAVEDLQRTAEFYQRVFDMEIMYREKDFLQLTTPGTNDIIVFEKRKSTSIGKSGGISHFGFRMRNANDIKRIEKKIKDAGGRIKDQGEFVPGSPYIFFFDPDGYEIEVWYEVLQ